MAAFVVPVGLLSIFPHQEPRFIIPVFLPLVFLFTHWIKDLDTGVVNVAKNKGNGPTKSSEKSKFNLKFIWYLCNIVLTLFYGFVHQGGVLPLTNHLSRELKAKPYLTHIHYFSSHTYLLPTSLLHLRNTKRTYISDSGHKYKHTKDFYIYELGSRDVESVHNRIALTVEQCQEDLRVKRIPYRLYYALPASFYSEFVGYATSNETQLYKVTLVKSFYPHFSMEKLPMVDVSWSCLSLADAQDCTLDFVNNLSEYVLGYLRQFSLVLLHVEHASQRWFAMFCTWETFYNAMERIKNTRFSTNSS